MVLQLVKQEYKRGEYQSEEDADSRNMRAENDLFIIGSSIICTSVLAVLSS
jgi:hypothetical protein